jgi:hypothetical protein
MKWLLLLLICAGVLLAVVVLVGLLLPRGHVASRKARFRQSPEALWRAISDYTAFPAWRPDIQSIDTLPARDGHVVYLEKRSNRKVTFEIMEATRPEKMVVRVADPTLPFGGSWTYQISSSSSGTMLAITEKGEVINPVFRFLSRYVIGHARSIDNFLKALGKKFGEEIVLEQSSQEDHAGPRALSS